MIEGIMGNNLVQTKLIPTRSHKSLVNRDKLLNRLNAGKHKPLTLITGPGGYGKTTLATLWRRDLISQERDVGWLTITPADNDLRQFVVYLAAAIDMVANGVGQEAVNLFNRDTSDATDSFVGVLVNEIQRYRRDIYLMIDDYHHIKTPEVHQLLMQLLAIAPDNFHLVIISRSKPPLSLVRLQAHDLITEVNFADLRLSFDEAKAFVENQDVAIDPKDLRALYENCDGWVIGMQLICIALKNNPNLKQHLVGHYNKVSQFSEYLEAEVLSFLPSETVDFMVLVSSCQKFNADLAAHLTDNANAAAVIQQLDDENIFLQPLDSDDDLNWYRFHPLMTTALRKRFEPLPIEEIRQINQRACRWFQDHDLASEAVRHAIYAQEFEMAADLIDACGRALAVQAQVKTLLSWSDQIPEAIVQNHVDMQLVLSWALVICRRSDDAEARIDSILSQGVELSKMHRYEINVLKAMLCYSRDDTQGILTTLTDIQDIDDDPFLSGSATNLRTIAYSYAGDYSKARDIQIACARVENETLQLLRSLLGECFIGMSFALQGDMFQAELSYRKALTAAQRRRGIYSDLFAMAYLAEVLYETGRWDEVQQLVAERLDLIGQVTTPGAMMRSYGALARIARYNGHINEARSYLELLEDIGHDTGIDRLVAFALYEELLLSLQEKNFARVEELLRRLKGLVQNQTGSESDNLLPDYCAYAEIPVFYHMARLRCCFAEGKWAEAMSAIDQLSAYLLPWRRCKVLAELKLLTAICLDEQGQHEEALDKLADCLLDCQRLGLQRTVLDEGEKAMALVKRLTQREGLDPVLSGYIEKLCWEIDQQKVQVQDRVRLDEVVEELVEPISRRETEILQLLAKALSNKKLALTLGIELSTVKWHLKNIYNKLNVVSRDEAVARARDLRLIE